MNEKIKNVWGEIECGIGRCFLHKKAAFYEEAGLPYSTLSIVSSAPPETIESFLGETKFEKKQNRYIFNLKGTNVELTTFPDDKDMNILHEKSFRHTLTIDSIGISSTGRVTNLYHGAEDVHDRVLRLTSDNATISEALMKRMLILISDGFIFDNKLAKRIADEKFYEATGYRKKLVEAIIEVSKNKEEACQRIANIIRTLQPLEHRRHFADYLVMHAKEMKNDSSLIRYLFLIFALLKLTSRELSPYMQGEKMLCYFDSVCKNLQKKPKTYSEFTQLKENYGTEFMDFLFDIQELFASIEGISYKRPSEKDFDMMAQLANEERFWMPVENTEINDDDDDDDSLELEGTLDFEKTVSEEYNGEDYEEPMEGLVEDDYEAYAEDSGDESPDRDDDLDEPIRVNKKAVCVDDEIPENEESGGFNADGLNAYEEETKRRTKPISQGSSLPKKQKETPPHRDHKSRVLMDGGE